MEVYRIEKEVITQKHDIISGTVPAHWVVSAPSNMQRLRYTIEGNGGATVSVVSLEGQSGGLLANVNRWRAQIGLDPIQSERLADAIETVMINGQEASRVLLENEQAGQALEVVIVQRDSTTFFVKITGDLTVVKGESKRFLAFSRQLNYD